MISTNESIVTFSIGSYKGSQRNRLGREGYLAIADAIRSNFCLIQHLSLRGTSIGSQDLLNLADAMKNYEFLNTLDVAMNRIEGVVGGRAVAMLIARQAQRQGGSPLTKIDLSYNSLGNEGLAVVLQQLAEPDMRLGHLDLTHNSIDLILGEMFETASGTSVVDVDHLVLDGNEFKKGGCYRLANLLGSMTHLLTLSLKDCMLND